MGPYLVPVAADWSYWVGVMVTTYFCLVLGLFLPPGSKKDPFWPKMLLWGVLEVHGGPGGSIFGPNTRRLLCLGVTLNYHIL